MVNFKVLLKQKIKFIKIVLKTIVFLTFCFLITNNKYDYVFYLIVCYQ